MYHVRNPCHRARWFVGLRVGACGMRPRVGNDTVCHHLVPSSSSSSSLWFSLPRTVGPRFSSQPIVTVTQTTSLNSSPSPSATSSPSRSRSRLEGLRSQLKEEEEDVSLDTFALSPSPQADPKGSAPQRKKARPSKLLPKPSWLRTQAATSVEYQEIRSLLRSQKLATVCEEARCPNIGECWSGESATATVMVMGDTCTRGCRFCAVKTSRAPPPLDPEEPQRVAAAVASWDHLDYVVLTSVDRDDVDDQGAGHFRRVVQHIRRARPSLLVEALTPDFRGDLALVTRVATSGLHVYAHNVETVERLTPRVRDRRAGYRQSLAVLEHARQVSHNNNHNDNDNDNKDRPVLTKTSLMLGLGETDDELRQTLHDLRSVGVDVVTFGQYLQPTRRHLPVQAYVTPEQFQQWQDEAEGMGFRYVASGPLVRSSYKAGEYYLKHLLLEDQQNNKRNHKDDTLPESTSDAIPLSA